jgi:hypothetical protein
MEFHVERVKKYGAEVWQHPEMDELRRKQCLCLNCQDMQGCPTAATLFELCNRRDVALAVTRCPDFSTTGGDDEH